METLVMGATAFLAIVGGILFIVIIIKEVFRGGY